MNTNNFMGRILMNIFGCKHFSTTRIKKVKIVARKNKQQPTINVNPKKPVSKKSKAASKSPKEYFYLLRKPKGDFIFLIYILAIKPM